MSDPTGFHGALGSVAGMRKMRRRTGPAGELDASGSQTDPPQVGRCHQDMESCLPRGAIVKDAEESHGSAGRGASGRRS